MAEKDYSIESHSRRILAERRRWYDEHPEDEPANIRACEAIAFHSQGYPPPGWTFGLAAPPPRQRGRGGKGGAASSDLFT